jgi:hypothetical protein
MIYGGPAIASLEQRCADTVLRVDLLEAGQEVARGLWLNRDDLVSGYLPRVTRPVAHGAPRGGAGVAGRPLGTNQEVAGADDPNAPAAGSPFEVRCS